MMNNNIIILSILFIAIVINNIKALNRLVMHIIIIDITIIITVITIIIVIIVIIEDNDTYDIDI